MAPSKLTGDTRGSCSQSDNGYITALSFLNSDKAMQGVLEETPVGGIDDHLVEVSEALGTVAKALRRAAEGKATAQAEAAEWKRKYELQRERILQLEHKGIPPSGSEVREKLRSWTQIFLDNEMKMIRFMLPCLVCWEFRDEESRRIFQEKSLTESNGDCDDARTNNVASQSIPIHEAKEKTDKCCGRHGICSHEVLRNGETDSDLEVVQNKMLRKASFKLSWRCKGAQSDQHKHDIVSFERGNITTAERSSKQIALRWESQPQAVLILTKPNSPPVQILCAKLISWLNDKKLDIYVELRVRDDLLGESQSFDFVHSWKDDKEFQQLHTKVDLVVTLGGDGTVLWAASMFKGPVPPLVPFSLGSLGFMTPFHSEHYEKCLDSILKGPFNITLRHRLQCEILKGGAKTESETEEYKLVLNEVTIDRGQSSFLTNLECSCDGTFVTRVQGDGLIISTTSGSTAYSLAAGGSMVHPQVPGILFTPICPHSLSFRPLILPEHVTLEVLVPLDSRSSAWVSFDGKDRKELKAGDTLVCRMAPWPVPTACQKDSTSDFLRSIHEGLHWNLRKTQGSDGPKDT